MTDIQQFIKILDKSDEVYRVVPVETKTHVNFPKREVRFIFDEKGKFSKILNDNK
jgi:hypothetical protein